MAGVSRLQYANEIRLIRVMCSGRVDLEFILRAFGNGQDGVFIGGCKLNECNYITQGNYDALGVTLIAKKIMAALGMNPERLFISFMNSSDGIKLAESINQFSRKIAELGPLAVSEGLDPAQLRGKLQAVRKLVPYLRLVERERLRVPQKSEQAYYNFYGSDQVDKLIQELVTDKLAMSQIITLLREQPLSTGEIGEKLNLSPSEVSRHMKDSTRHGLVRYDMEQKRFALA